MFTIFLPNLNYEITKVSLQFIHILGTYINSFNFPVVMGDLGSVPLVENFRPEGPPPVVGTNSPFDLCFGSILDAEISIKKCFLQNCHCTKEISLGEGGKLKYQDSTNRTYPPLFTEFSHGC